MKSIRIIVPIVVAIFAAGVAQGAMWQWSRTASSNATADPSINLSEGMSPSSVNDSARAMMARTAEFRDDISGSITTGGSATAFTVTTNQVLAATPTTGQLVAFTPHTTNGAAATLRADGGTVYAIQTSPGVAVGAATLVEGTPYSVKFNGTAWILRNVFGNPFTIPIGGFLPYVGASAPNSNFVLPFGQCLSRTVYAVLFALVSTTYGTCDGVTTFGVPDLRGRVIAGDDDMGGANANRLTSTYFGTAPDVVGNTGGSESNTLTSAQMPSHTHTATVTDPAHTHGLKGSVSSKESGGQTLNSLDDVSGSLLTSVSSTTGITVSNSSTGGGNPHAIIQPTIIMTYLLRVL